MADKKIQTECTENGKKIVVAIRKGAGGIRMSLAMDKLCIKAGYMNKDGSIKSDLLDEKGNVKDIL